jgi:hypothetical protein
VVTLKLSPLSQRRSVVGHDRKESVMGASKKFFKTLASMKRMVRPSSVEKDDAVRTLIFYRICNLMPT